MGMPSLKTGEKKRKSLAMKKSGLNSSNFFHMKMVSQTKKNILFIAFRFLLKIESICCAVPK